MGLATAFFITALVWGVIFSTSRSLERLHLRQLSLKFKVSQFEACPYLTTLARLMNLRLESTYKKDSMFAVDGVIELKHSASYDINFATGLQEAFIATSNRLSIPSFIQAAKVDNEAAILSDPKVAESNGKVLTQWLQDGIYANSESLQYDYFSVWLRTGSPRFVLDLPYYFLMADKNDPAKRKRMDLFAFLEPKDRDQPSQEYLLYLCIDHRWYCIEDELIDANTETASIQTKITPLKGLYGVHVAAAFYRSPEATY